MEQHPIPRQITTFEFKLIGFMTLKQFIYLIVFLPFGFIVYSVFPIPILNIVLGVIVASMGFILAFVPLYDRPLDSWIKNFLKRLTSPTQYLYHKENAPRDFFRDLFFIADPHKALAHVESQKKLTQYLQKSGQPQQAQTALTQKKKTLGELLRHPQAPIKATAEKKETVMPASAFETLKQPALAGVVKNNKKIPLPGILIYVKDQNNKPLRLLKTNPHGIFATYSRLPEGEYTVELKDPKGGFSFDTMKIKIEEGKKEQLELFSKEMM